jgi:hypothetical protein
MPVRIHSSGMLKLGTPGTKESPIPTTTRMSGAATPTRFETTATPTRTAIPMMPSSPSSTPPA